MNLPIVLAGAGMWTAVISVAYLGRHYLEGSMASERREPEIRPTPKELWTTCGYRGCTAIVSVGQRHCDAHPLATAVAGPPSEAKR